MSDTVTKTEQVDENNEAPTPSRGDREGSARSHGSTSNRNDKQGDRKHQRSDRDRSSRNDRDDGRDRGDYRDRRSGGGGRRDSSRDRNSRRSGGGGERESKRRRGSRSRSRERHYDDKRDQRDNRDNRDNRDHSRRDDRDSRNRRRGSPLYNDRSRDQDGGDGNSSPRLTEEEREMRSVFVIQLSSRVGDRELAQFFENNAGAVREARVITDRISRRSKGVGYVEFVDLETVGKALALSQTVLLGIPIVVQYTEAEKNRQARDGTAPAPYAPPYQPAGLYVGSLNFALTESDIRQVFQPFGAVEMVNLQKDPITGKSKGYAFVQFKDPKDATQALEKMNNFPLAGREIKVGLVAEKGSAPVPRQAAEQQLEDYNGGNLTSISRIELMQKLSRSDRPAVELPAAPLFRPNIPQAATTNVLLKDAFNPEEETDRDWDIDLRDDIKTEVEGKYGKVVEIFVVKESKGEIYIKFETVKAAAQAVTGLNGRWFGGRQLGCSLISDLMLSSSRV